MTNRNNISLQYVERNNDNNDIINIMISWENGDMNALQDNLNIWLRSINAPLRVVAEPPKK